MLHISKHDEQLKLLKKSSWLPWVGKHFCDLPFEHRILFIGESHYLNEGTGEKEKYDQINMTRAVVNWMAINENYGKSQFFPNIPKLIWGNSNFNKSEIDKFWNHVAFYNFIQQPMVNISIRPTYAQLEIGRINFLEVIDILKPSVCIFLGVKAEYKLNEAIRTTQLKVIDDIHPNKKINNCWGRYGKFETEYKTTLKLIFVKHPSKFFTPQLWNNYLKKYIPGQMDWFNTLLDS